MKLKITNNREITALFALLAQTEKMKNWEKDKMLFIPEPPKATKKQIEEISRIFEKKHYYKMVYPFLSDLENVGLESRKEIKRMKELVKEYRKHSFDKEYSSINAWEKRMISYQKEKLKNFSKIIKETEKYIKMKLPENTTVFLVLFNPSHGMSFTKKNKLFITMPAISRVNDHYPYWLLHEMLHSRTNVLNWKDKLSLEMNEKFKNKKWGEVEKINYGTASTIFNESLTRAVDMRMSEKITGKATRQINEFGFLEDLIKELKTDYERKEYKNIQEFGVKKAEEIIKK